MDHSLHLDLGIQVLKALLTETSSTSSLYINTNHSFPADRSVEEVRKALASFLSKLNLPEPEDVEAWQVKSLQQLVLSIPTVSQSPFMAKGSVY